MSTEVTAYEYDDVEEKEEAKAKEEEQEEEEGTGEGEDSSEGESLDPAVEKARDDGWVPQDEWKGKPEDWVDYREFNVRGELMGRIKSQSTQLHSLMDKTNSLEEALKVLGEHNKKIAETEYNRALKTLKEERKEARENDDYDALDEIDEQIDELKAAKKELSETKEEETKLKAENKGPTPEQQRLVQDWLDSPQNQWYAKDKALARVADSYIMEYAQDNPNDLEGALEYMNKEMRNNYADKVGGTSKKGSAVTEADGRNRGKATGKSTKFTVKDLTDEEKRVGKTFVDQGVFDNMQEWADSVAKTRES